MVNNFRSAVLTARFGAKALLANAPTFGSLLTACGYYRTGADEAVMASIDKAVEEEMLNCYYADDGLGNVYKCRNNPLYAAYQCWKRAGPVRRIEPEELGKSL